MSLTWFEVVPAKELPPLPHVPDPCWSAQASEMTPLTGSTLMDG